MGEEITHRKIIEAYKDLSLGLISRKEFADIMNDPVNHPKHYTLHPSGIECITITRHMNFNLGNALKYIWRAGLKDSNIQDLEKAI